MHRHIAKLLLTASLPALLLGATPTLANLLDPSIVAGGASVAGQGTAAVTVTQTTDKAIIDWHSFDIGTGETTTFVQPGSGSVALNRVTGGLGASTIDGALKANEPGA